MEDPELSPSPLTRSGAYGLFIAFVILQLVVPLTYYARTDAYDERFAWRMFSAIRLYGCQTQAFETRNGAETPLDLDQLIHNAWVNHLRRNRRDVAHAFLERRCEGGAERVRIVNQCRNERGEGLDAQTYEQDCATGEVQDPISLSGEDRHGAQ